MSAPEMNAELLDIIYGNPWIAPPEKRILELRFREGLYYYQISQELHCSERTVRRTLDKILKKVHPLIMKYYDDHPEYLDHKVSG